MTSVERWARIVEAARSAARVEPYRNWGPGEWWMWATAVLSALSRDEALEILFSEVGISGRMQDAKPAALRTALVREVVGSEALAAWQRTRRTSARPTGAGQGGARPESRRGVRRGAVAEPSPRGRMAAAVSEVISEHPALEPARQAGVRIHTATHPEAIWISTPPNGAEGPEIEARYEGGPEWWEPLTRTHAREIAERLASEFAAEFAARASPPGE